MPPGLSLSVLVGQSVARSHRTKPSTPGTSAMSVSVTVCCPPSADAKRRERGADAPVIRMFMLATLPVWEPASRSLPRMLPAVSRIAPQNRCFACISMLPNI